MSEFIIAEEIPKISDYEFFISDEATMPDKDDPDLWIEVQGLETITLENEGNDITVYYLGRGGAVTTYNMEISPTVVITGVRVKNDPGQKELYKVGKLMGVGNARKWWIMAHFDDDKVAGRASVKPFGLGGGAANEIPRINMSFAFDGIPSHTKIPPTP